MQKAISTHVQLHRGSKPVHFGRRILLWMTLWRERRALQKLDPRLMADVGIDPVAAHLEADRPFWDVPDTRRLW
ncbi:MAG: DUF1127 domain-containing protein [Devosia sp.]